MNLGKAIKIRRRKKQLTQKQLAALSGITQNYLSQIEHNLKNPSIGLLEQIAKGLETPLPFLTWASLEDSDIKPHLLHEFKTFIEPVIDKIIKEFE